MKNYGRTPWFPGVEVPSRTGVFERRRWETDSVFYSYWDGRQWWPAGITPNDAVGQYLTYRNVGVPRWVSQLWYWRGRTKDV